MTKATRIALVTTGLGTGGGVPTLARWLTQQLDASDEFTVDVHDLATSSRDRASRLISRPTSILRSSLRAEGEGYEHWGANFAEFEPLRYRPRRELTVALNEYDLVQVVAGGAAIGHAMCRVKVPMSLLAATRATWERRQSLKSATGPSALLSRTTTGIVRHQEDLALREADAVQVLNEEMLTYTRRLGQQHAVLAPYGVDTTRFTPAKQWNRAGPLVTVCRLGDERKGLNRMLEAYLRLLETSADVPRLILAGHGNLGTRDQQLVNHPLLRDRVEIQSDLSLPELSQLLQSASVFVQASYEEGLGIAVLEAMACGLPVVASRTAGTAISVVDGTTGELVPQDGNGRFEDRMATSIASVLHCHGDRMSVAARRRIEQHFSNEVALSTFTSEYRRILAGQRR